MYSIAHKKVNSNHFLSIDKILIFLSTKDTRILLFQVEHYTINMDIIRYYLLPNFMVLKLCDQNYE